VSVCGAARSWLAVSLLGALAVLPGLAGCAHDWRPLDAEALRRTRPATLLLVTIPSEGLLIEGGELYGILGMLKRAHDGAAVSRDDDVVEPTAPLADSLAASVARAYGLDRVVVDASDGSVQVPRIPRAGADLILEVRATRFGFGPVSRSRWAVHYTVEVKLTDTRTSDVRAQGVCRGDDPLVLRAERATDYARREALTAGEPTYDEMLADQAGRLKTDLARAATRCQRSFETTLLFTGG
jgi:hypothetical protein